MTLFISFLAIVASLLAIVSGVWVIMGLGRELINPSNEPHESSSVSPSTDIDAQKN